MNSTRVPAVLKRTLPRGKQEGRGKLCLGYPGVILVYIRYTSGIYKVYIRYMSTALSSIFTSQLSVNLLQYLTFYILHCLKESASKSLPWRPMRASKIVQFVFFETTLPLDQFIPRWEQYSRSVGSDLDVTLQQAEKNGKFTYIAQHRCAPGELQFMFAKSGRSSRTPQVEIKAKQIGGYTMSYSEKLTDTQSGESKVFAFIPSAQADLNVFKKLTAHGKLNIYEAYYENCQYAYVLEYFVKTKNAAELLEQLKLHEHAEIGIYKECAFHPA